MNKQRIEAGKSKLDELMTKAKSSDCWKKAVEGIEKRCKNLGDTEQSYLAIDFTNSVEVWKKNLYLFERNSID